MVEMAALELFDQLDLLEIAVANAAHFLLLRKMARLILFARNHADLLSSETSWYFLASCGLIEGGWVTPNITREKRDIL